MSWEPATPETSLPIAGSLGNKFSADKLLAENFLRRAIIEIETRRARCHRSRAFSLRNHARGDCLATYLESVMYIQTIYYE